MRSVPKPSWDNTVWYIRHNLKALVNTLWCCFVHSNMEQKQYLMINLFYASQFKFRGKAKRISQVPYLNVSLCTVNISNGLLSSELVCKFSTCAINSENVIICIRNWLRRWWNGHEFLNLVEATLHRLTKTREQRGVLRCVAMLTSSLYLKFRMIHGETQVFFVSVNRTCGGVMRVWQRLTFPLSAYKCIMFISSNLLIYIWSCKSNKQNQIWK